ncbi:MAGUK p55 subfamily member 6-like isoform X1 [Vespa mandarinia]|uniref:MAGUK p55 subfamily member 6-like isoform X1 n=2 Tax=Vespa mandarinia TaxID=7446 RepID=UPI001608D0D1|nr:MAGUK p55 subfamily member 6-like isoform X1 [Vespa mandarinia]XP_047345892.1 protein PALS2 isoform X1 [Vespa velutina]
MPIDSLDKLIEREMTSKRDVIEDICGCSAISSIVQRKDSLGHFKSTSAAFMHVRENLEELGKVANDTDLLFLKGLLDSPVVTSLVKVQERLEDGPVPVEPVCSSVCDIVDEVCHELQSYRNEYGRELVALLRNSHLKALLETHDAVVERREASPISEPIPSLVMPSDERTEVMRVVGLTRQPDEPLGLTVQVDESGNLIIARILGGSTAARQRLLRIGEVILEVNGKPVHNPDELQQAIHEAKENLFLKLAPGIANDGSRPLKSTCYMRALFDYEPSEDTLLPCKEIGLRFNKGNVLQIVDQADPNWWQARRVEGDGLSSAGLIPSLELEERRKAFVPPEADFVHKISICGTRISKKKKRKMYQSKSNGEFDGAELLLYEEVARMPPFRRKTLALVGPRGVGRRTLKNRLINSDREKFGTIVPYTSRPPRVLEEDGKSYWFTDRESMERDIREHRYLEYGEHGGHLYGTKLDSVRELIRAGKMCVLDCSPAALKILHNSTEFMPYVIFIAAPGMEQLKSLYDLGRSTGASSRNLTFDRQSSIRYSSRRARTLESLASLYEEDDLKSTLEESAALQRAYEKYIDLVIINEDFDQTFRQVIAALDALATEHQWVPVNWIY